MPVLNDKALRFLGGSQSAVFRGNNSLFAASSIPDFMAFGLWGFHTTAVGWRLEGSNDISPLALVERPLLRLSLGSNGKLVFPHKPAVQVECGAMPFDVSKIIFPHDLFMTALWTEDVYLNSDWSISSSAISHIAVDDESGKGNFNWIDFGNSSDPKLSLAGVFAVPRYDLEAGIYNSIYACTIGANWIPTEPWIDPATDIFIHEASPQPFTDMTYQITGPGGSITAYSPLYIDPGWAESLSVQYNVTASNQTAMETIASARLTSTGSGTNTTWPQTKTGIEMSQCLQMGLALYITDGLARMHSTKAAYFASSGPAELRLGFGSDTEVQIMNQRGMRLYNNTFAGIHNYANYTEFRFEVLQYGYGYGFRGILIYIAAAVLLIHTLLAFIHMCTVMVGGFSSSAWGAMGEMMVLAVNSSSTEQLRNTCAVFKEKDTWGLATRVRETSNRRLELVFEENDTNSGQLGQQVKPGRKYG